MWTTDSSNLTSSTSSLSKGTTSERKRKKQELNINQILDVHDRGDLGLEITFNNYTRITIPPKDAQAVIVSLKNQIRARANPSDRYEHWEAYVIKKGIYENNPEVEGRVFEFDRLFSILMSRATKKEKEALGWIE